MNVEAETIELLKEFKEKNPWKGKIQERKEKFMWLHGKLCELYQVNPKLEFDIPNRFGLWHSSGQSSYNLLTNTITLRGRLSVITLLHEFSHSITTFTDEQAQIWATNLFKKVFPQQWEKLRTNSDNMMERE